jgi:hypothetical protein
MHRRETAWVGGARSWPRRAVRSDAPARSGAHARDAAQKGGRAAQQRPRAARWERGAAL